MKKLVLSAVVVATLFLWVSALVAVEAASVSSSLGLSPYPAKGQSPDQQNKDEGECYAWAKQQTGIDPMASASAPPPSGKSSGGGERVRGAARGAAAGATVAAVTDNDAGKGAAAGAVVGTMAGGRQKRQNQKEAQQQAQQQQASTLQTFNKAFGSCMEGRGYTVK